MEPPTQPDPEKTFADYLQQNIAHTVEKLADLPDEQARLLQARLGFLQAEAAAQKFVDNGEAYWKTLLSGLEGLLPENTPEAAAVEPPDESISDDADYGDEQPTLNELDDIDVHDSVDNIPTLQDNISQPNGVKKDPTLTIETANEDLERLRKIIHRQHDTMDELKKSLSDKNIGPENNKELSKKLEEIEVAQAQLNMCVETLEKENQRLNEMIRDYEDSPQQEQLILAKQELDEANERITTLEKENTLQAERISELESEIAELKAALEKRNEELARVQSEEVDLSQTEESEEHSQDSLMKEIESLTELITQKSEELSKLQSENVDEFDVDGLTGLDPQEPVSNKAQGSR